MNNDNKVIDLLRKQERRYWTYGQVVAWKSSSPGLVLFHFGPRGLKRLKDWTQKEKSSLTQALRELKPDDDQTWGLVSLYIEGQERTGLQCKTFTMLLGLSLFAAEEDHAKDDALKESIHDKKQAEARECANALRASVSLDDDELERQSSVLPDFSNLKLEIEFSRPKSSSLIISTSDCFNYFMSNRKSAGNTKSLAESSSTNLNATEKENLASSPHHAWDEEDILRPRIKRRSKPKALVDLVDKDDEDGPSDESKNHAAKSKKKDGVIVTESESMAQSDIQRNQNENDYTPVEEYYNEPTITNESRLADDAPTSKRRRKLVPAVESDDDEPSSESLDVQENENNDNDMRTQVENEEDDDVKQVISPLALYLGIKRDLIESVLDRCLVLLARNQTRGGKTFKRLNGKYETIEDEAHAILCRLRREYEVDDADDQRFLNGFDDDDKAQIPQGVTEEEYHELRAKSVNEAELLVRELLARAEPLLSQFKELEKHIYVEDDQQPQASGLDEFDVELSDEEQEDDSEEADPNDGASNDEDHDDLLVVDAGDQGIPLTRDRFGRSDDTRRRRKGASKPTERNHRKSKPSRNSQNERSQSASQSLSNMGHLSRRPDYIMKDDSVGEGGDDAFEYVDSGLNGDDHGDEYREARSMNDSSLTRYSQKGSEMVRSGSDSQSSSNHLMQSSSFDRSLHGRTNSRAEDFQSSSSSGHPLATVGPSRPSTFSSSSVVTFAANDLVHGGMRNNSSSFEARLGTALNDMDGFRANRSMSRDALATTTMSSLINKTKDHQSKKDVNKRRNQGYWHRMGVVSEQTALPVGNNYTMPNLRDDLIGKDPIRSRNVALVYHMEGPPAATGMSSSRTSSSNAFGPFQGVGQSGVGESNGLDQLMDYLHEEEESESRHALFSNLSQPQLGGNSQSSNGQLAVSQSWHSQQRLFTKTRFLSEKYLDAQKRELTSSPSSVQSISVNDVKRPGADPVSLISDLLANPSKTSFDCIHDQFVGNGLRNAEFLDRLLELVSIPVLELVLKEPPPPPHQQSLTKEYVLPKVLFWCIHTKNKRLASLILFKLALDVVKQKFSSSDFCCESFTTEQMACFEMMKRCSHEFEWNFWRPFNEALVLLKTSGAVDLNRLNWTLLVDELRVMIGCAGWKDEWDIKQIIKSTVGQIKSETTSTSKDNMVQFNFECFEFAWAMVFQLTRLSGPNQSNLGFILDVTLGWLPLFTKQVAAHDVESLRHVLMSLKKNQYLHSYLALICKRIQTLLLLSSGSHGENRISSASGIVALGLFNCAQALNGIAPQQLWDSWLGLLRMEWQGIDSKNARLRLATEIFNLASYSSSSSSSSSRVIEQIFVMSSLVGLSDFSTQYDKLVKKVMALSSSMDWSKIQDEDVENCVDRMMTSLCQMASKSPKTCLVSEAYFAGRIADASSVPLSTPGDAMLSSIRSLIPLQPGQKLSKALESLLVHFEQLCLDDLAARKPQNFVGLGKMIQMLLLETVSKSEFRQHHPNVAIEILCLVKRLTDLKPKPDVHETDESYAEISIFMEADMAVHRVRLGDAVRPIMRSIVPRFLRDYLSQSTCNSESEDCCEKIHSILVFAATCVVEYFTRPTDKDVRDGIILALATTLPWPPNASSSSFQNASGKRTFLLLSADFICECLRLGLPRQAFTNQQLYDAFWHAFCLTGADVVGSTEFVNKYMILCASQDEGESSTDFCNRQITNLWGLEQRQMTNLRLLMCHRELIPQEVKGRLDMTLSSASVTVLEQHKLKDLTSLAISCEMPRLCWHLAKYVAATMNHNSQNLEWTNIASQLLTVSIVVKPVGLNLVATQQEFAYMRTFVEQNVSKSNGELARIAPNVMEEFWSAIFIVDS